MISRLNFSISQGVRKEEDKFDYNKDVGMFVCPAGHMAVRKTRQGKKRQSKNQSMYTSSMWKNARPALHVKEVINLVPKQRPISIKSDDHKAQMEFQQTERFKILSKERYKIEAKNAELKNVLGYDRTLSYGLSYMEMQGTMTIFAANIRRTVKMMAE